MQLGRIELNLTTPPSPSPAPSLPDSLQLIGAHGGAGTSTLAVLLGGARDLGTTDHVPEASDTPMVLVARNTVPGSRRAVTARHYLGRVGHQVRVLAIVDDGFGEPRDASSRFALLAPQVAGVVRVPFMAALRLTTDPGRVSVPSRVRRALDRIAALAAAPPVSASESTRGR
ncbi:hypothetical protein [Actinomadura harenae]|uniref:Uncharacterized protein n=1 Tax=Actinomadura harenae TaxID=2483351 RepID=A0A3M2M2V6_9ACTN|nr:hypothetical protein [Actinomadura harenae]RMI43929.1 hypothetical protein EBO15_14605 [Actinomadura harenae]